MAKYKCDNKKCGHTLEFEGAHDVGSVTHEKTNPNNGIKYETGSRITCVKCMTFQGMKRVW